MATNIADVWETWERYAADAADPTTRAVLWDMLQELCGLSVGQTAVCLDVADYLGTWREAELLRTCHWLRGVIRRHANAKKRCPLFVVVGRGEPEMRGEPGYYRWTETGGRVEPEYLLKSRGSRPAISWVKPTVRVEVGHQWVWEYFSTVSGTSSS